MNRLLQLLFGLCILVVSTTGFITVRRPNLGRYELHKRSGIAHESPRRYQPLYSSTVADPKKKEKVKGKEDTSEASSNLGKWEVRLFNDPFNKREFVARCLNTICGKSDGQAFQIMMEAHEKGMGVIGRYAFEVAENYVSQLQGEGLLVNMVKVGDDE
eukprot:CAMPEP_0194034566 /NCGR_PEP_ID=MMETSP0009_2-20130614/6986_1 /TAXON_ID=210454 /ORGANISM="Grammatophora oceanica, Strain CCMP 410" /LENGTH=157 /DNA_ID=CAMNT_0038675537 /DNA_START=58 /DNA_END=531 /DNA_ORIENTATION=-